MPFEVTGTEDGVKAVDMCREKDYDVIVVDVSEAKASETKQRNSSTIAIIIQ